jgi:hypothetical protein
LAGVKIYEIRKPAAIFSTLKNLYEINFPRPLFCFCFSYFYKEIKRMNAEKDILKAKHSLQSAVDDEKIQVCKRISLVDDGSETNERVEI